MTIARFLPEYCYNPRRTLDGGIVGSVVHYISGKWQFPSAPYDIEKVYSLLLDLNRDIGEREWFKMDDAPQRQYASYHFLISRAGEIWQLVDLHIVAWHAGASLWRSINGLNDFFFGVALIGGAEHPYTVEQYAACAALHAALIDRYDFSAEAILGHEDVALPRGRKHDPGPHWNWSLFRTLLAQPVYALPTLFVES